LASGGTNLFYGIAKGTDAASSLVWATVSVGVSIIFALSWPAFIVSLDRRQWSRALLVLIALILTGTYSVTAALGSAMGGRANAAIEEKDTTDKRAKAQAAYDVARAELATLKSSRPVAELEAMRKSWHERMGKKEAWFYEPELARAKRRAELDAKVERAAGELANTGSAKVANSDAVALAAYLSALGIESSADRVNKLLVLLAVLVIECGGGLALAVGLALGDASRHAPETQKRNGVPPETQGVPAAYPKAYPAFHPRSIRQQRDPAEPLDQRLLRLVMERGGTLVAGQREIGRLIGVSSSHAHRLLHDLSGAGIVSLSPGRTGTVVKRIVN
jgi:uncharacterized membrane protein